MTKVMRATRTTESIRATKKHRRIRRKIRPVEMTPEIDAGFAQIAQERIARHPFRYYVWLPLKRARSLWFDTHSQYYPFEGELLPLDNLDQRLHQQYLAAAVCRPDALYTLLGIAGGWFLVADARARMRGNGCCWQR